MLIRGFKCELHYSETIQSLQVSIEPQAKNNLSLLLFKKVGIARLTKKYVHPLCPQTPALQH